jgi:hypothetical protein
MTNARPVAGGERLSARDRAWARRFLAGALLALSLYLVEAGAGQILLTKDAHCRQGLLTLRWGQNPDAACMPVWEVAGLRGLSEGVVGAIQPSASPLVMWTVNGLLYASLGGLCAQMSAGLAVGAYLGLHTLLILILSVLRFLEAFVSLR